MSLKNYYYVVQSAQQQTRFATQNLVLKKGYAMANVLLPSMYGVDYAETAVGTRGFSLQFHITAECDQQCKHCYMYNTPSYYSQIDNTMSKSMMFNLIDEYFSFLDEFHCVGAFIAITGGDPLLSPHFWDILQYIQDLGRVQCTIAILGNPYHVDETSAKKMKEFGVSHYQISLDGRREVHDSIRKPGSFDDSIRALEVLHKAGIHTTAAMTVSKLNCDEIIPLYDYLRSKPFVDSFGFDRMVPVGNGEDMKKELFTPHEYRQLLFDVYKHEVLNGDGMPISKKEQLWKLLFFELGLIDPIDKTKGSHYRAGCHAGTAAIDILSDGTVLACRRLELEAGKYPENSLRDIVINNEVTKTIRQRDKYEGCSSCEANLVCRGCPAMKYAFTGSCYGKEPYCWRMG